MWRGCTMYVSKCKNDKIKGEKKKKSYWIPQLMSKITFLSPANLKKKDTITNLKLENKSISN
jgi:hypothetical protein